MMSESNSTPSLPTGDYEWMEWTPERVATFWNFNSHYPEYYFANRNGPYVIDFFSSRLRRADRILDFGCGAGFLIRHLLDRGHRVAGTDFSDLSLKDVREQFSGVPNFLGAFSVDELIARGEKFSAIFLVEVVEHLDDAPLDTVIESVRALLAPGGVLLITTPNDEDLSKGYVCNPDTGEVFHRWQHVRSWTAESLAQRLSEGGLEAVDVRAIRFKVRGLARVWRRLGLRSLEAMKRKRPNLTGVFRLAGS
jgi:2-polyprenyl-3-methyl-5-hydroxy-6-metoxy-1,4-benzoquinol methylase